MAYKRNPMRSERICSLARFVMSLESSAARPRPLQWLERTLDDSANRRLMLPQAFLATDAVLILCQNVARGLVVYPRVIAANLEAELPFMATENILMAAVAAGGDRQDLHERIRRHSQAAAAVVKEQGGRNDLLDRLAADPAFAGRSVGHRASGGSSSAAPRSRSTSSWPRWSSRFYALSRGGPLRRGSQGVGAGRVGRCREPHQLRWQGRPRHFSRKCAGESRQEKVLNVTKASCAAEPR